MPEQNDGRAANPRAVIQAGGRGSRLRPLTDTTPKPLLPVGGQPMVERILRSVAAAGVRDITVVVGWKGERIVRHLEGLSDLPAGVRLKFIVEEEPLGTVGALALLPAAGGPVVLANGDLVTDLGFHRLLRVHAERGADLTIASHEEAHRLHLGELVVDARDRVVGYREKPEKRYTICSGIAVVEPQLLSLLEPGRPAGLPDLVVAAVEAGYEVVHWRHGAFWMDVNTAEDLRRADARCAPR